MREMAISNQELRREALRILQANLRGLERGRCPLRIPRLAGQMRQIQGMHFHVHPELFLQISGMTRFGFPGDRFNLAPGEICIVPRGVPHAETARAYRGPFRNLVVVYDKQRVVYHLARERPAGHPSIEAANGIDLAEFGRFAGYLDDAVEVFHGAGVHRKILLKGLLLAFFAALQSAIETDIPGTHPESFKVAQTRQWIMANLADTSLSVKQLAQRIRCSPDYLSWLFHQETGGTLNRYIHEQRLGHARFLLEQSAQNISEIAWAVGYSDPGYFARRFRRITGQSPRSYRRGVSRPTKWLAVKPPRRS